MHGSAITHSIDSHKHTCRPRSGDHVRCVNRVHSTRRFRMGEDLGQGFFSGVGDHLCAPDAQLPHALSVDAVALVQVDKVSSQVFDIVEIYHVLHTAKVCEELSLNKTSDCMSTYQSILSSCLNGRICRAF